MAENTVCAHELCECTTNNESGYCSDHCRDVTEKDITEIKCDCGHPGC